MQPDPRTPARFAATSIALAFATSVHATEPLTASDSAKIDQIATLSSQAASRMFGKSAAFCASQKLPENVQLVSRLDTVVATVSAGTRDALIEMAQSDPAFLATVPLPTNQELAAADRQGDELLRVAHASPAQSCAKLDATLKNRSAADLKALLLKTFRAQAATRAAHCAATPKPADCK